MKTLNTIFCQLSCSFSCNIMFKRRWSSSNTTARFKADRLCQIISPLSYSEHQKKFCSYYKSRQSKIDTKIITNTLNVIRYTGMCVIVIVRLTDKIQKPLSSASEISCVNMVNKLGECGIFYCLFWKNAQFAS